MILLKFPHKACVLRGVACESFSIVLVQIFSIRLPSVPWSSLHSSCQSGIRLHILPAVPLSFFLFHIHTSFSLRPQHTSQVSEPTVSEFIILHISLLQKVLPRYLLNYPHYGEHRFGLCYVRAQQLLHVHCRLGLRQFSTGERPSCGANSGMQRHRSLRGLPTRLRGYQSQTT